MREIIEIKRVEIGSEEVNSVNARELYEALEIKQQFTDWIKKQITTLGLEEDVDYLVFHSKVKNSKGGRSKIEYIITTDSAKHIAMASRTAKGREVRNYFIEIEKRYKESTFPKVDLYNQVEELVKKARGYDRLLREYNLLYNQVNAFFRQVAKDGDWDNPNIASYIEENLEVDFTNSVSKKLLYHHYTTWCKENGIMPVDEFFFFPDLRKQIHFNEISVKEYSVQDENGRSSYLVGIKLKNEVAGGLVVKNRPLPFEE